VYTVLIIEDDKTLSSMLVDFFSAAGYKTLAAIDGDEGYKKFQRYSPHIILMDIMLPTIDGFSLCRKIRKVSTLPIIIITGRTDADDQLMGYDLKADDYVTKPFNPEVLIAKAGVILERVYSVNEAASKRNVNTLSRNGLVIQKKEHLVFIDDQLVNLEPKQFQILWLLMRNENLVFTREQLLNIIWGFNYFGSMRLVDSQINKLRKRLNQKSAMISTVSGIGYKFCSE